MRTVRELLKAKTNNWAVCLLSASVLALAVSNWGRPSPVVAQAPANGPVKMSGESRAVLNALEDAFVNIADSVEPAVVTIEARAEPPAAGRERPAPDGGMIQDDDVPAPFRDFLRRLPQGGPDAPRPRGASTGSGVIIRQNGRTAYVLTNNHVVDNRDKFRVTLSDKREYLGTLVGRDERTDLAVLKFEARENLPAGSVARLGNSDDVKVGQWAIAIGSPLGYKSTLTVGVISALGRELNGLGPGTTNYADLIQTDASINPGNSGGALVNIEGQVVGINVAIASNGMSQGNIGIGFAIPVNTARMVADQLITTGKVTRGYLGIGCSSDNRELAHELKEHLKVPNGGALAETVHPNTPAARAGLQDGDVIVKLGTKQVRNFTDLENVVASTAPGSTLPAEVVRNGELKRMSITIAQRPSEKELLQGLTPGEQAKPRTAAQDVVESKFGLGIRPAEDGKGVEVANVAPGSSAFEAGLRPGDVVLQVGNTPTPTPQAFQKAMDGVTGDRGVVMRVRTAVGLRFVVVKP
ncbi:MAG: trypsin-like peptidase domain-containing protein [Armatimonadota bacterium]